MKTKLASFMLGFVAFSLIIALAEFVVSCMVVTHVVGLLFSSLIIIADVLTLAYQLKCYPGKKDLI